MIRLENMVELHGLGFAHLRPWLDFVSNRAISISDTVYGFDQTAHKGIKIALASLRRHVPRFVAIVYRIDGSWYPSSRGAEIDRARG